MCYLPISTRRRITVSELIGAVTSKISQKLIFGRSVTFSIRLIICMQHLRKILCGEVQLELET